MASSAQTVGGANSRAAHFQTTSANAGSAFATHMTEFDAVENTIWRGAAMLETFAALIQHVDRCEDPQLSESAAEGLKSLALNVGKEMKNAFNKLVHTARQQ